MHTSLKRLFVSLALVGSLLMPSAAVATFGGGITICHNGQTQQISALEFLFLWWLYLLAGATLGPCDEQPQTQTTGELTINKYVDQNANQTQDGGEDPHEGVMFTVTGPNAYSETAQTDASGQVVLSDLEPGDYTVTEAVPNQYRSTTGESRNVSVSSGQSASVEFGNQKLGKLRLKKFQDLNGDGDQDAGEADMAGVEFHVTGPEGYDATFTTNSSGLKHLFNLAPGEYTVTETVPAGYAVVGSNPRTVDVGPYQAYVYFGNKPAGKLRLKKYEDLNGNGAQDAGEGTMSGVEFTITGPNGYSITKNTNSSGLIKLFNLVPGEYTVTETVPAGYTIVGPNPRTKTVGGSLAYVNVGNEPEEVEVETTPTPTPTPEVEQTPESTPTPEVEVTPEVEGSPDPTDDPGVNDQGTRGSSQSDPSDPGTPGSVLAPVSFADTGLNSLAGLGTTLVSIGAYAAVRRRLRRS